jgi:hypothetical protein
MLSDQLQKIMVNKFNAFKSKYNGFYFKNKLNAKKALKWILNRSLQIRLELINKYGEIKINAEVNKDNKKYYLITMGKWNTEVEKFANCLGVTWNYFINFLKDNFNYEVTDAGIIMGYNKDIIQKIYSFIKTQYCSIIMLTK